MPSSNTGPASNGVFLCSKGCRRLDRHFEHESTPPNGVFLCSKLCLHTSSTKACPNRWVLCSRSCCHLDAHETTPRMACFCVQRVAAAWTQLRTRKHNLEWCVLVLEALPPS